VLVGQWLGEPGAAFVAELTALANGLAARGGRSVEIERKFLLRELPQVARAYDARTVDQGWLPGERLVERLRRVRGGDGRERYFRTVKVGAGIARLELEEETTAEMFAVLWPLTASRRVRKRRYAIPDGALTWEIDAFTDRELVLAEVELTAVDEEVELPPWLAEYVVREVTGEGEYVNYNLGRPDAANAARP
jgi:CYTH domain-containing protein